MRDLPVSLLVTVADGHTLLLRVTVAYGLTWLLRVTVATKLTWLLRVIVAAGPTWLLLLDSSCYAACCYNCWLYYVGTFECLRRVSLHLLHFPCSDAARLTLSLCITEPSLLNS